MENEFSRVADALPRLAWTALPGGHIDFFHRCYYECTGLSAHEAYGHWCQRAIHPEVPELLESSRSIPASVDSCDMEERLRRLDGSLGLDGSLVRINKRVGNESHR